MKIFQLYLHNFSILGLPVQSAGGVCLHVAASYPAAAGGHGSYHGHAAQEDGLLGPALPGNRVLSGWCSWI